MLIDYSGVHYEIQARQFDGLTGRPSPVVRRDRTRDREFVAKTAALLIDQDFGLVGTFDAWPHGGKAERRQAGRGEPQGGRPGRAARPLDQEGRRLRGRADAVRRRRSWQAGRWRLVARSRRRRPAPTRHASVVPSAATTSVRTAARAIAASNSGPSRRRCACVCCRL